MSRLCEKIHKLLTSQICEKFHDVLTSFIFMSTACKLVFFFLKILAGIRKKEKRKKEKRKKKNRIKTGFLRT
jgi:hypothetical protein